MFMLALIAQTLGALLAGICGAVLTCWLAWSAFKLVRHPEWGPLFVFLIGLFLLRHRLGSSFVQVILLFSAVFTMMCWLEGGEWRARRARKGRLERDRRDTESPWRGDETRRAGSRADFHPKADVG